MGLTCVKKGLSSETASSAGLETVDHCKVKWGMPGRPECNSNFLFNHRPTQQKDYQKAAILGRMEN